MGVVVSMASLILIQHIFLRSMSADCLEGYRHRRHTVADVAADANADAKLTTATDADTDSGIDTDSVADTDANANGADTDRADMFGIPHFLDPSGPLTVLALGPPDDRWCGGVAGLGVWREHLVLRPDGPGRAHSLPANARR